MDDIIMVEAIFGFVSSVVSTISLPTIVKGISDWRRGKAEEEAAEKREKAARKQADETKRRAKETMQDIRERGEQVKAAQRTGYGASGVRQSGTVLDLQAETDRLVERDAQRIWEQAKADAEAIEAGADIEADYAAAARESTWWNLGTTLLTSVSDALSYVVGYSGATGSYPRRA